MEELKGFIIHWNAQWGFVDRWWREKYKISFNSPQHREKNLIDMRLEYEEDRIYLELMKKDKKEDEYQPGYNDFLKERKVKMTEEMIDEAFDNIKLG